MSIPLRAPSHGDERRRRVLIEESIRPSEAGHGRPAQRAVSPPAYSERAHPEHQPRVTDFVPLRIRSHLLLVVMGGMLVAGLALLFAFLGDGDVHGPWALHGEGSLAVWFSGLVLLASTATALLIYSCRRHRTDDYRARYRVWVWAALVLFIAATLQVTQVLEAVRELVAARTGITLITSGTWWSIGIAIPAWCMVIWVLAELWETKQSFIYAFTAVVCWTTGWAMQRVESPWGLDASAGHMVSGGLLICGQFLVWTALLWHARGILRTVAPKEAESLNMGERDLSSRPNPKAPDTPEDSRTARREGVSSPKKLRVDLHEGIPEPNSISAQRMPAAATAGANLASPTARKHAAASAPAADVAAPDSDSGRKRLSKADRKALKKLREQERRERDRGWFHQ